MKYTVRVQHGFKTILEITSESRSELSAIELTQYVVRNFKDAGIISADPDQLVFIIV